VRAQAAGAKKGAARAKPAYASLSRPNPINLPEEVPCASIGAEVRTDRLDDDSPWRLQ
jgi:hypothetical protein